MMVEGRSIFEVLIITKYSANSISYQGSDSHGLKNGTRNGTRIHKKVQFEKEICTNYLIFLL